MKKLFWGTIAIIALGFVLIHFVLPLFWFALGLLFKVIIGMLLIGIAIFAIVMVLKGDKKETESV